MAFIATSRMALPEMILTSLARRQARAPFAAAARSVPLSRPQQPTTLSQVRTFVSPTGSRHLPRMRTFVSPIYQHFTLDMAIGSGIVNVLRPETKDDGQTGEKARIETNVTLQFLLDSIDRNSEHAMLLRAGRAGAEDPLERLPLVKVVTKLELIHKLKRKEQSEKTHKKKLGSSKELVVSWAIDDTDLERSCGLLERFLAEGRQVQVTISSRSAGGSSASGAVTGDKRRAVLLAVRDRAASVKGAREFRAPETGSPKGGNPTVMMYFQGPTPESREQGETDPGLTAEALAKIERAQEKHRLRLQRKAERELGQAKSSGAKRELLENRPRTQRRATNSLPRDRSVPSPHSGRAPAELPFRRWI